MRIRNAAQKAVEFLSRFFKQTLSVSEFDFQLLTFLYELFVRFATLHFFSYDIALLAQAFYLSQQRTIILIKCKDGIDVVIFRGNNRNRRRGFHNTYVFYQLLQRALAGERFEWMEGEEDAGADAGQMSLFQGEVAVSEV